MPFIDSLDVANRACQHCGVEQIFSVTEDSQRNYEIANAYDKVRRAELRRNIWRFAVRKAALRAVDSDTMLVVPSSFDISKTYYIGEFVQDTNGLLWVSEQAENSANQPGGNNTAWDMYFGPMSVDLWDSTAAYSAGELVYVITNTTPNGYQVYMSLISANSDTPGTATAWSATAQYKQDDVVSYNAQQWVSLLPINLNNTPAAGPASWSAATAYTSSQQVTGSDNYIYTAASSTTGNDPTTDGGVHWTNTGALNAWSVSTKPVSSINWRPVVATLKNITTTYPLGAGPSSQSNTRNVFRLPAGYLRTAPQFSKQPVSALGGPSGNIDNDWEYDGNYIVSSDCGVIVLRFVADISKVSAMDDMFCEGFAARIATAVAPRLTQSDAKLQTIASAYQKFMGDARLVNAIEEGWIDPPEDEFLAVRY